MTCLYSLYSLVTTKSLNKGKSGKMFRQQVIYLFILVIIELPFAIFWGVVIYFIFRADRQDFPNYSKIATFESDHSIKVTHVIYYSRGFVLNIVRLMEPGFFEEIRSPIKKCFDCNKRKPDQDSEKDEEFDPNVLFLNSKNNNLTVCGIL